MEPIPYGKQHISKDDEQAVLEALRHPYLTQGPKIEAFEKAFAEYIGSKYAVALSNGTAALHLSALALGVRKGQKIITTPLTFAASANCIKYCGGEVVFADIDPDTYLLDCNSVENLLKKHPKGTFSGVIPVDFSGRAVDTERLKYIAEKYNLWILEDACHAPGGFFTDSKGNKQYCGNGQFSDVSIFSFHPVKHIACGEGGMALTNDYNLYEKIKQLRSHGIIKDSTGSLYTNSIDFAGGKEQYPAWYMEMQDLGYNYRITDIQCALGISQLKRADEGLKRRREIARIYEEAFRDQPFIKGQSGYVEGHAYHLYVIEVEKRRELYNYLREHHIYAQIHYIPCHLMPYYRQFGWKEGDLPQVENYYKHCISLPMFPTLTDEEQQFVIQTIKKFYE